MAKYDIDKTLIATTDPVSLCDGLSLFPPFPDIGAGVSANGAAQSHDRPQLANPGGQG